MGVALVAVVVEVVVAGLAAAALVVDDAYTSACELVVPRMEAYGSDPAHLGAPFGGIRDRDGILEEGPWVIVA